MVIAQALGEYVAISALIDAISSINDRAHEAFGDWGMKGLVAVVAVGLLWKLITVVR